MDTRMSAHEELAALLEYPDRRYREHLERATAAFLVGLPEAASALDQFAARLEGLTLDELQELFTQTVDVDPPCSLNLGSHLGPDCVRQALLLEIARARDVLGLGPAPRGPDALPDVLVLLARMAPADSEALVRRAVAPALERMRAAFAERRNPYELVLRAVYWLVLERHLPRVSPPPAGSTTVRARDEQGL